MKPWWGSFLLAAVTMAVLVPSSVFAASKQAPGARDSDSSLALSPMAVSQIAAQIRAQKYSDAIASLQKVDADSSAHPWAVVEAAKIYYRQQRWSKFFGLATYAESHFKPSLLRDELLLLEVLALLRHCQNEQAVAKVRLGLQSTQPQSRPRWEMLASLLEVAPTAPDEEKTQEQKDPARSQGWFGNKHVWPISPKAVDGIDAWKLERKVEPTCESEAAP